MAKEDKLILDALRYARDMISNIKAETNMPWDIEDGFYADIYYKINDVCVRILERCANETDSE